MSVRRNGWWIVLLLLSGCRSPAAFVLPTLMPVAVLPTTAPAILPATRDLQTAVIANITAVPSATPFPLLDVAPSEDMVTTLPAETAYGCREMAALTAVHPSQIVRPGPWPRPAAAPGLLGQAANDGLRLIHLGFDVEGDPYVIADLLAALDRHQVRTTFFVLGSWADTYPEWVQEFSRRGHELATHGYSHADMTTLSADQIAAELNRTERTIVDLTGQTTKPWLRPPYGSSAVGSIAAAYEAGYTTVIWTGSANDWRQGMDADKMCASLRYYALPGAILYAHTNKANIVTAVDRFIPEMQDRGYTFVPLSVLMADDPSLWLQAP